MNKVSNAYIRAVKKHLTCSAKTRRKLINQLNKTMSDFLEENPDATLEMLYSGFGTPSQMVAMMIQDLPSSEILVHQNQRRIVRVLTALILALVFTFSIYVFFWKEVPIQEYIEVVPSNPSLPTSHYVEEESP